MINRDLIAYSLDSNKITDEGDISLLIHNE